jgi:hypothetical protein
VPQNFIARPWPQGESTAKREGNNVRLQAVATTGRPQRFAGAGRQRGSKSRTTHPFPIPRRDCTHDHRTRCSQDAGEEGGPIAFSPKRANAAVKQQLRASSAHHACIRGDSNYPKLALNLEASDIQWMRLIERESQLAALDQYATEASQGQGRLVLISGEAGVGKSVLLEEFAEQVEGGALALGGL